MPWLPLQVPVKQLERRQRAVDALADHSRLVLEQLRDAEDELLAGEQAKGAAGQRNATQHSAAQSTLAALLVQGAGLFEPWSRHVAAVLAGLSNHHSGWWTGTMWLGWPPVTHGTLQLLEQVTCA